MNTEDDNDLFGDGNVDYVVILEIDGVPVEDEVDYDLF